MAKIRITEGSCVVHIYENEGDPKPCEKYKFDTELTGGDLVVWAPNENSPPGDEEKIGRLPRFKQ